MTEQTDPAVYAGYKPKPSATHVHITDVDIPFWSLMNFMFKVAFAAIPVTIMVVVIYGVLSFILVACGVALGG